MNHASISSARYRDKFNEFFDECARTMVKKGGGERGRGRGRIAWVRYRCDANKGTSNPTDFRCCRSMSFIFVKKVHRRWRNGKKRGWLTIVQISLSVRWRCSTYTHPFTVNNHTHRWRLRIEPSTLWDCIIERGKKICSQKHVFV